MATTGKPSYKYKVVSSDWDSGPLYPSLRLAKQGLVRQTERTIKAHENNLAIGFDFPDPEPYFIVRRLIAEWLRV